jgi:hypothetical protein
VTLVKILTALLIPIFASEAIEPRNCRGLADNVKSLCQIGNAIRCPSDSYCDSETAAGTKGDEPPPPIIFGPRDRYPDPVNNSEAPSWRRSESDVERQFKETAEDLYLTPTNSAGDPQPHFDSCRAPDCKGASFTVPLGAPAPASSRGAR